MLPPGWIQAVDASTGRTYFACHRTGESRWDPPPTSSSQKMVRDNQNPTNWRHIPRSTTSTVRSVAAETIHSPTSSSHRATPELQFHAAPELVRRSTPFVVEAAQSLVREQQKQKQNSSPSSKNNMNASLDETSMIDLELKSLSAGQIADLCHLEALSYDEQRGIEVTNSSTSRDERLISLQPLALLETAQRPAIEPGRLDVQLHTLYAQLEKLE